MLFGIVICTVPATYVLKSNDCTKGFGTWMQNTNYGADSRQICGDDIDFPNYCSQTASGEKNTPGGNNCFLPTQYRNTACCLAWENKCRTMKVFSVFIPVAATLSMLGPWFQRFAIGCAVTQIVCLLIFVGVATSITDGQFWTLDGNNFNFEYTCGLRGAETYLHHTVGYGPGLIVAIVSLFLVPLQIYNWYKLMDEPDGPTSGLIAHRAYEVERNRRQAELRATGDIVFGD